MNCRQSFERFWKALVRTWKSGEPIPENRPLRAGRIRTDQFGEAVTVNGTYVDCDYQLVASGFEIILYGHFLAARYDPESGILYVPEQQNRSVSRMTSKFYEELMSAWGYADYKESAVEGLYPYTNDSSRDFARQVLQRIAERFVKSKRSGRGFHNFFTFLKLRGIYHDNGGDEALRRFFTVNVEMRTRTLLEVRGYSVDFFVTDCLWELGRQVYRDFSFRELTVFCGGDPQNAQDLACLMHVLSEVAA